MAKNIEFTFELAQSSYQFKVESFQVTESVSFPFQVSLTLLCEKGDIAFNDLSRQEGLLSIYGQGMDASRNFHGVVNQCRYLGQGRTYTRYQLTLVPSIWF